MESLRNFSNNQGFENKSNPFEIDLILIQLQLNESIFLKLVGNGVTWSKSSVKFKNISKVKIFKPIKNFQKSLNNSRIYSWNKLHLPRVFKKDPIVTFYVLNNNFFSVARQFLLTFIFFIRIFFIRIFFIRIFFIWIFSRIYSSEFSLS